MIVYGVLCLVPLVALVCGFVAGRRVDRLLAEARAEAARDDPNWELEKLVASYEPVPDSENSALVTQSAFAALGEDWRTDPPHVSAAVDAYQRGVRGIPPQERLDNTTAHLIRESLRDQPEALELARSLADYARGSIKLEFGANVIDTPATAVENTRWVGRLLYADAALRAQDGDPDGAIESCRAVLGLARSIGEQPFIVAGMVRVSFGSIATEATQRVIAQGEPGDEALERLQGDLVDELRAPIQLQNYRGERGVTDEGFRRLRDAKLPIWALRIDDWDGKPVPTHLVPLVRLLYDYQRAVALKWTNRLVAAAHLGDVERTAQIEAFEPAVRQAVRRSNVDSFLLAVPASVIPQPLSNVGYTRNHAALGATVLLVAAERHRRRHGEWPASLAAIDKAILPEAPLDPFSGKSFLLERGDGRFLIHSVGPNGRDEGGAYDKKTWIKGGPDDVGATGWDPALRAQRADSGASDVDP